MLGQIDWDQGVEFLEGEEYELLRRGQWEELDTGTERLVDSFFETYDPAELEEGYEIFRLFVHTKDDWNTWVCYGPMPEEEALQVIDGLGDEYALPKAVRPGVFDSGPDCMTKYELFRGYTKIEEHHVCRGQGEYGDISEDGS